MLLLPKFEYHEPRVIADACKLLSEIGPDAKIIAGGTDILVNMKKGLLSPKHLVSLGKIPGLSEMKAENGRLAIGSHVIVSALAESVHIRKVFPGLHKAASVLGSPLVRNRATIGGNMVTARPAADLPPPLMALSARLKLHSPGGERELPLEDFFLGPGETVIKPDEVLVSIVLNNPPPYTGGDYIKLGHRRALEIAIVAVASRITLDRPDGVIKEARVILSSVAPKAIHALSAEKMLIGKKPSEKLFAEAAAVAETICAPIDDVRASAEYRCAMVEVLTKRTLMGAWKQAVGN
jgi:CO/xanthine dehydrogenase FAD-binding subunit